MTDTRMTEAQAVIGYDIGKDGDVLCYVEGDWLPGGKLRIDRILYGEEALAAVAAHEEGKG